jgi:hypothetical protein
MKRLLASQLPLTLSSPGLEIISGLSEDVGGVPQYWRELKAHHRQSEFIHDPYQGGFGIGLLYVD